jgi:hypothetical protein
MWGWGRGRRVLGKNVYRLSQGIDCPRDGCGEVLNSVCGGGGGGLGVGSIVGG